MASPGILVIDGNAASRDGTIALLRGQGEPVLAADGVDAGLELARRDEPALILLDHGMGEEAGLRFCRALRADAFGPRTLIALTSDADLPADAFAPWREAGADELLVRPFRPGEIASRLRLLLRLRESESARRRFASRFHNVFDTNCVGMIFTDIEGTIREANDTFLRMVGYGRDDLDAGRLDWKTLTPPEFAPADARALEELATSGVCAPFEKAYRRKDGELVHVIIAASVMEGEQDRGFAIVIDRTEYQQARRARLESDARFRSLVAASPDGIYLTDADGRCVYANEQWLRVAGLSLDEALGDGWAAGLHPDDREGVFAGWRRMVETGGVWKSDYRFRDGEGRTTWVSGTVAPMHDADGVLTGYVGVNTDVTARRRAMAALEEAQALARVGSWEYDVAAARSTWSVEMFRIAGMDPEAGEPTWEEHRRSIHPDDWDDVERAFADAVAEGRPYAGEYRILQEDGGHRWVQSRLRVLRGEDGAVVRLLGTTQDIDDLKRIEEELRGSERRFRSLFEGVPISLWEEDFSDVLAYLESIGFREIEDFPAHLLEHPEVTAECAARVRIRAVNRASLDLHEAASFEDLMDGLPSTFTERSYETFREQVVAIWMGKHRWVAEGEVKTLGGKPRQVLVHWSVPPEHRETLSRVFVSLTDITEKASLEQQLRQSQKMESIGRLAGGVAHDFNNLLTVILNYSNLILEALEPGDPVRGDAEQIRHAGQRAADLTRQLLAFSRKQIIKPRVIELNEVMRNSEKMLQRLIGEDITLVFSLDESLDRIDMDPGQMNQVLVNLAVNARDAMPDGGELVFETSNADLDRRFCDEHPGLEPGPHVMIAVTDTGSGMDEETQSKIFEPFFTTKSMEQGTGLGLSTVYGIVKQGNGSIAIESEIGTGTTFRIHLPIARREPDVEPDAERTDDPGAALTVLLIEDEDAVRRVTRRMLESNGYEVLEAARPGEALEIARTSGDSLDLVLSDVVMPEMSGKECHEQLDRIVPGLKVLFMSGYTPDAIARRGVLEAGIHFIQKPFDKDALGEKLRSLLED